MATYEHLHIAKTWAFHRIQPDKSPTRPYTDRKCRQMHAAGDVLNSWGSHFPLVRILRTPKGRVRGLLLNGDTWNGSGGWAAGAGNTTTNHQAAVLRMAEDFHKNLGIPYVTVPQSVLDAAGIDTSTVTLVHRTDDWYEDRTEEFDAEPVGSRWRYDEKKLPGTGGWVNQRTGQFVQEGWPEDYSRWVSRPPGEPGLDYANDGTYEQRWEDYHRRHRQWGLQWVYYPPVTRRTGHRTLMYRHGQPLEQYVRADGTIGSRYHWRRHWLGESLITAKIPYQATVRCPTCTGTGMHRTPNPCPGRRVRSPNGRTTSGTGGRRTAPARNPGTASGPASRTGASSAWAGGPSSPPGGGPRTSCPGSTTTNHAPATSSPSCRRTRDRGPSTTRTPR